MISIELFQNNHLQYDLKKISGKDYINQNLEFKWQVKLKYYIFYCNSQRQNVNVNLILFETQTLKNGYRGHLVHNNQMPYQTNFHHYFFVFYQIYFIQNKSNTAQLIRVNKIIIHNLFIEHLKIIIQYLLNQIFWKIPLKNVCYMHKLQLSKHYLQTQNTTISNRIDYISDGIALENLLINWKIILMTKSLSCQLFLMNNSELQYSSSVPDKWWNCVKLWHFRQCNNIKKIDQWFSSRF